MKKYEKTLCAENGEMFVVIDGRRVRIAACAAEIKLYARSVDVPVLGKGRVINERGAALLVTFKHRPEYSTDENAINRISRIEFQGDILQTDGAYAQVRLDNCLLDGDLDLTEAGTCQFEIRCSQETLDRLRAM